MHAKQQRLGTSYCIITSQPQAQAQWQKQNDLLGVAQVTTSRLIEVTSRYKGRRFLTKPVGGVLVR